MEETELKNHQKKKKEKRNQNGCCDLIHMHNHDEI